MRKMTLFASLIFLSFNSNAQYEQYLPYIQPYLSAPIESGFFHFKTPNNIQAGQLYELYKITAPDLDNDMVLVKVHSDSTMGMTHYKYQQMYKGLKVEVAGCIEHYQSDGSLNMLNAKIADSINKSETPRITPREAVHFATRHLSREHEVRFAWEDPEWERDLQVDLDDPYATYYPEPELMWAIDSVYNVGLIIPGSRYTLAYLVNITTIFPNTQNLDIFIDANTGELLKKRGNILNDGIADIHGYGNQIIDTRWAGSIPKWILHANNGNRDIHTKKDNGGSSSGWSGWNVVTPGNMNSSNDNWIGFSSETSPHYFATQAWDYYSNNFGRAGYNWNGLQCRIRTNWSDENAYYFEAKFKSNGQMKNMPFLAFGNRILGAGSYSYGWDPSVVAHEYTHGVINFTANLKYEFQSGALNESFADIFGIVIPAQMLDNGITDWTWGNSIPETDLMRIRRFDNPSLAGNHWTNQYDNFNFPIYEVGQPEFFNGNFYCQNCPFSLDYGGVHINSSIQNRWFHLLANGGFGWNENGETFNVVGIGIEKAARIAYFNLTSVLLEASQFTDSRQGSVWEAINIFGECSIEHQSTINAWHAVGVGGQHNCNFTLTTHEEDLTPEIIIYPNPVGSELNIKSNFPVDGSIKVFDAFGRVVLEFYSNGLIFSQNIENLAEGVYYITFTSNNKLINEKMVVKR